MYVDLCYLAYYFIDKKISTALQDGKLAVLNQQKFIYYVLIFPVCVNQITIANNTKK